MASHSLPAPVTSVQKQSQERTTYRPSVRIVITVFVALLILFSWLRFILAMEIALTGRQIQLSTEELQRIERSNDDIRLKIAEALSPEVLAPIAENLGFMSHQPIYVPLPKPLLRSPGDEEARESSQSITVSAEDIAQPGDESLLDAAASQFDALFESETVP